jgi:hypothetical protein
MTPPGKVSSGESVNPLGKLLVLVKQSDASRIVEEIGDRSCASWEQYVEIRALAERKRARKNNADPLDFVENTSRIIGDCVEGRFAKIISMDHLMIDRARLKDYAIPIYFVKSKSVLLSEVFDELKKQKVHWLEYAQSQWGKSELPGLKPEAWVHQFHQLDCGWVGRNLIKLLKVISNDELRQAFTIPRADHEGLKVVHAYFKDDEPGSSSLNVRKILEHLYESSSIIEYSPTFLTNIDPAQQMDIIYVYEDGLWSGVELVRRLNDLCCAGKTRNEHVQIHFRYGVTSDAGLIAGRLFTKKNRIRNVQLRPAHSNYHFGFLQADAYARLQELHNATDDEIRQAIDDAVEPFAFQSEKVWGDKKAKAMDICACLGSQLVLPFLERREREKLAASAGTAPPSGQVSAEKCMRWALGALRFASTVAFSSSVPKPLLPLMWLEGPVRLNNVELHWRPLFRDVRRTGIIDCVPDCEAEHGAGQFPP